MRHASARGFFLRFRSPRFHDKIDDITGEIRALLGEDLREIDAPSVIFRKGQLLRFPLSPLDLFRKLGPFSCLRAAGEIMRARLAPNGRPRNFVEHATRLYGKTIAASFLLNYTEKLWGRSCDQLSPTVAGERLSGLHLRGFFLEWFLHGRQARAHGGDFSLSEKGNRCHHSKTHGIVRLAGDYSDPVKDQLHIP